eukprot:4993635-Alexandrium_andersonii.AAC.1
MVESKCRAWHASATCRPPSALRTRGRRAYGHGRRAPPCLLNQRAINRQLLALQLRQPRC